MFALKRLATCLKNAKHDIHAVLLKINFLQATSRGDIVQGQVRGPFRDVAPTAASRVTEIPTNLLDGRASPKQRGTLGQPEV